MPISVTGHCVQGLHVPNMVAGIYRFREMSKIFWFLVFLKLTAKYDSILDFCIV